MAVTGSAASTAPGDFAGRIVGALPNWAPTFRLVRQLGDRGAEGTTYEAERLRRDEQDYVGTGELVALKVFDRDAFWRDNDSASRALHERLQDLEELAHVLTSVPGIVRFRSPFVGAAPVPPNVTPPPDEPTRRTYLPMDLVPGPTLQQALERAPDAVARWRLLPQLNSLAQALRGLASARPEAPLAHRDVKPANLILTGEDDLILVDLGLLVSPRRSVTAGVGSFGFMAPEQQASGRLDPVLAHRVDWFAFYATAACVVTGEEPPWSVRSWPAWLDKHPEITSRARHILLTAASASAARRPEPWSWFPAFQAALADARRVPLRALMRAHRQPIIAAFISIAVLITAVTVGAHVVRARTDSALSQLLTAPSPPKLVSLHLSPDLSTTVATQGGKARLVTLEDALPTAGDMVSFSVTLANGQEGEDGTAHDVQLSLQTTYVDGCPTVSVQLVTAESDPASNSIHTCSEDVLFAEVLGSAHLQWNTGPVQSPAGPRWGAPIALPDVVPGQPWSMGLHDLVHGNFNAEPAGSIARVSWRLRVDPMPRVGVLVPGLHARVPESRCAGTSSLDSPTPPAVTVLFFTAAQCWSSAVDPPALPTSVPGPVQGYTATALVVLRNPTDHTLSRIDLLLHYARGLAPAGQAWTSTNPHGPWQRLSPAQPTLIPLRSLKPHQTAYVLLRATRTALLNECQGADLIATLQGPSGSLGAGTATTGQHGCLVVDG